MSDTQLAVISDIHGNRWALEAVLEDIERRGIRETVNLGDNFYGPLDPAGTANILIALNQPTVRGNEDRIIVEPSPEFENSPTLRFVRESLSSEHLEWLSNLRMTLCVHGEFLMCHGSLDRDDEYLLHKVTEAGVFLRSADELAKKLGCGVHGCDGDTSPERESCVLLCGHDHVQRMAQLPDGRLIVNPGSVGLPAYTDDVPFAHVMEAGTPHTRYSIVSKAERGWRVENISVPYDWQLAADAARSNGRPDWAEWLQTGRADAV